MKKIIDLPDTIFIALLFLCIFLLIYNNVKLLYILILLIFILITVLFVSYLYTFKKSR